MRRTRADFEQLAAVYEDHGQSDGRSSYASVPLLQSPASVSALARIAGLPVRLEVTGVG
jgi:hypothetical protein